MSEPVLRRVFRRTVSIGGYACAWTVCTLCLGGLPLLALVDALRGSRLARCRALLVVWTYLSCELLGLTAAGGLWLLGLARPGSVRGRRAHVALQRRWACALFGALRRIYGLRCVVEGPAPHAGLRAAPTIVLARHVSLVDTLLPMVILGSPGLSFRYVLKRELLWDPCLDVVGQRLPNAFVQRGSGNVAAEVERVARLARGLRAGEMVVIFPEGTRFTPARRRRILEKLAASGDALALERARALEHLLPLRPAGTRALIAACPEADLLFLAHRGLEGARTLASFWKGALVGRELRVELRRVPASEVPRDPADLDAWLHRQWQHMDAWIGAGSAPAAAEALGRAG